MDFFFINWPNDAEVIKWTIKAKKKNAQYCFSKCFADTHGINTLWGQISAPIIFMFIRNCHKITMGITVATVPVATGLETLTQRIIYHETN